MTKDTKLPPKQHVVVGRTTAGQVFAKARIPGDQVKVLNSGVFDRAIQRAGRSLQTTAPTKKK